MQNYTAAQKLQQLRQPKQKQEKIISLLQNQTRISSLQERTKLVNQQLINTKDILRKYRQKNIPSLCANPQTTYNQTALCLNSAGFFHELPLIKMPMYFETRIQKLTKEKKQLESQIKNIISKIVTDLKQKIISGADLNPQIKKLVEDYLEDMEDNE